MKTLILSSIILLTSLYSIANDKEYNRKDSDKSDNAATVVLSGAIIDENSGESLVGVEVQIEGTNLKTYTDFDGKFSFENVKPGACRLTANYISYERKSEKLELESTQNDIKIKLQSSN
ncbi:MAG TPA: carboxypeptidase-like regulatory domain-containing protein [Prolixibacteraceae bacterium]|nr:carboxypeptidase-like regulatory domain-containing protein [Prolixibacteraceae bacterium]